MRLDFLHMRRLLAMLLFAIAAPMLMAQYTIVLDAGHGGKDKGAAHHGAVEKNINLAVAKRIKPMLERQGYKVVMTRTGDTELSLERRVGIANSKGAKNVLFVSIHCNAHPTKPQHHCADVHVHPKSGPESSKLASMILNHLVTDASRKRGIVNNQRDFMVIRGTKMPAVLVEMDYITNNEAAKYLKSGVGQEKLARAISNGIIDYVDSKQPATYRVQIYASAKKLSVNDAKFKGVVGGVQRYYDGGKYKYTTGNYTNKADADARCQRLKGTFPDAFVVKFRGGKRLQ